MYESEITRSRGWRGSRNVEFSPFVCVEVESINVVIVTVFANGVVMETTKYNQKSLVDNHTMTGTSRGRVFRSIRDKRLDEGALLNLLGGQRVIEDGFLDLMGVKRGWGKFLDLMEVKKGRVWILRYIGSKSGGGEGGFLDQEGE